MTRDGKPKKSRKPKLSNRKLLDQLNRQVELRAEETKKANKRISEEVEKEVARRMAANQSVRNIRDKDCTTTVKSKSTPDIPIRTETVVGSYRVTTIDPRANKQKK